MEAKHFFAWSRGLAMKLSVLGLQIEADGNPWHDIEKMAAYIRRVAMPACERSENAMEDKELTMPTDNGRMPLNLAYIRQRRDQLGLTQQQASDAAGFPNPQKWSQYENGHIPDPQLSSLEAIARALRCSVAKLLK